MRPTSSLSPARARRSSAAFTLGELMVAVALFSLTMTAAICSHLFGMRMFNVAATKLNESFSARAALNHVQDDIRECKLLYVGNGNEDAFTNVLAAKH